MFARFRRAIRAIICAVMNHDVTERCYWCDKQNRQKWTASQMSNCWKSESEMKINVATEHVSPYRSVDDLGPLDHARSPHWPQRQRQKIEMIIYSDMFVLHEFSIKMVMFAVDDKMALLSEFNPKKRRVSPHTFGDKQQQRKYTNNNKHDDSSKWEHSKCASKRSYFALWMPLKRPTSACNVHSLRNFL